MESQTAADSGSAAVVVCGRSAPTDDSAASLASSTCCDGPVFAHLNVRLEMTRVRGGHDLLTLTRIVAYDQQGRPRLLP